MVLNCEKDAGNTIFLHCDVSLQLVIMKYLHFRKNEYDKATHPAPKMYSSHVLFSPNMIMCNIQGTYIPECDASMDESLMAYKEDSQVGYSTLHQSCSRGAFGTFMYTFKGTKFSLNYSHYGTAMASVLPLMEALLNLSCCLTTDNFFTTPRAHSIPAETLDRCLRHSQAKPETCHLCLPSGS